MDFNSAPRYTISLPKQKTSWNQVVHHEVTADGMLVTFECLRPREDEWHTDPGARVYSTQYVKWEQHDHLAGIVPSIIIEQHSLTTQLEWAAEQWKTHEWALTDEPQTTNDADTATSWTAEDD